MLDQKSPLPPLYEKGEPRATLVQVSPHKGLSGLVASHARTGYPYCQEQALRFHNDWHFKTILRRGGSV
jgi:hypothetical protein